MAAAFVISEDVVSRRMGEEMVLVHLRTNQIHTLNPTAARTWELLQGGHDLEEIKRVLLGEFEVEAERVDREVKKLLIELERSSIIRRGEDD